jgi:hypothetical protein
MADGAPGGSRGTASGEHKDGEHPGGADHGPSS